MHGFANATQTIKRRTGAQNAEKRAATAKEIVRGCFIMAPQLPTKYRHPILIHFIHRTHFTMSRIFAFLAPALVSASAFAGGFSFQDEPGKHLDVLRDGKLIARYMYEYDKSTPARREETYKPYLHVFDADGKAPITKGAGGSFTHHRGIYIGWNKLGVAGKTYDRWHMKGGEQVHEKFTEQKAGDDGATFTSLVKWTGEGSEAVLEEERTLKFLPAPAPAYAAIEMTSKLKAVGGETKLEGDPEHSGLQFRPSDAVDRAVTAYFFPVEKPDPRKDRDYPWVGETFGLGGKHYSVLYINHPDNAKDAVFSTYRDYGRFGAWFKGTIPAGGTQTFRVRFLVAEGEMLPAAVIQKTRNEFAGTNDPVPTVTRKGGDPKGTPKPKEPAKPAASSGTAPTK